MSKEKKPEETQPEDEPKAPAAPPPQLRPYAVVEPALLEQIRDVLKDAPMPYKVINPIMRELAKVQIVPLNVKQ